jgi:DNA-directed RNA polymerase subunit beta
MYSLPKNVYRERIDFSKIKTTVPIPNLIEIQKKSYERFLQMNRLPSEREDAGLQSVFKSVFPISDFRENSSLEFIEYSIGNWECKCGRLSGLHTCDSRVPAAATRLIADPYGEHEVLCPRCGKPNDARGDICDICGNTVGLKLKYDVDECQERGMTYAVPLKVTIRLVVWNKDPETGVKTIRDIKEQEVYYGDIPLMTDNGTFIINGTERVIVSQLHRSPGAFFHSEDKTLYIAQIIPYRGSWVEFEYDAKNLLYVRIDRKRKFLATVFLRALGLRGADEIIRSFYTVDKLTLKNGAIQWAVGDSLLGLRARRELKAGSDTVTGAGKKINANAIAALEEGRGRRGRSRRRRARRRLRRDRRRRSLDRRGHPRGQRAARTARHLDGAGEERREDRDLLPREGRRRQRAVDDAEEGPDPHARRGADRDLPPPAAGRPARRSTARATSSRACSSTRRSTTSRASAG